MSGNFRLRFCGQRQRQLQRQRQRQPQRQRQRQPQCAAPPVHVSEGRPPLVLVGQQSRVCAAQISFKATATSSRQLRLRTTQRQLNPAAKTLHMKKVPDLSAVLHSLLDRPLLGPKPDQLLVFKRPQLAVKLHSLMQPTASTAAKQANSQLVNQVIAALYQTSTLHDHVVGWAPLRSGQQNAEVHLCFKDDSAYHRQQLASAGSIHLQLHGAATSISLPVSTVAAKQLPDITTVAHA